MNFPISAERQQDESKREKEQGDGDNFQEGTQSTPPSQHQWERARGCAPLQTPRSLTSGPKVVLPKATQEMCVEVGGPDHVLHHCDQASG